MQGEELVIGGNAEQAVALVERMNQEAKARRELKSGIGLVGINGATMDPKGDNIVPDHPVVVSSRYTVDL